MSSKTNVTRLAFRHLPERGARSRLQLVATSLPRCNSSPPRYHAATRHRAAAPSRDRTEATTPEQTRHYCCTYVYPHNNRSSRCLDATKDNQIEHSYLPQGCHCTRPHPSCIYCCMEYRFEPTESFPSLMWGGFVFELAITFQNKNKWYIPVKYKTATEEAREIPPTDNRRISPVSHALERGARHHAALDVPPGAAVAPGARPERLSFPAPLPQREISRRPVNEEKLPLQLQSYSYRTGLPPGFASTARKSPANRSVKKKLPLQLQLHLRLQLRCRYFTVARMRGKYLHVRGYGRSRRSSRQKSTRVRMRQSMLLTNFILWLRLRRRLRTSRTFTYFSDSNSRSGISRAGRFRTPPKRRPPLLRQLYFSTQARGAAPRKQRSRQRTYDPGHLL